MDKSNCLVIDIECYSDKDINTQAYLDDAKIKWIGMYSYRDGIYGEVCLTDKNVSIQRLKDYIREYKTLITFNGDSFDIPILKNNKIIDGFYYSVDVMKVLSNDKRYGGKGRGGLMGYDFKGTSLRAMAEMMKLETQKGDINYKIFAKDEWTDEERIDIKRYLRADIAVTKQMFDKLYDFWMPFTEFIDDKNKKNWSWIKSTIACLVYKMACNMLQVEEIYGTNAYSDDSGIGALVIEPKVEEAWDLFYCDAVSLYPHIFAMFNLMAELITNQQNGWHGNDEFKVKGYYDISTPHKMSIVLMDILKKRIELKRTDKKNRLIYAYKIFLNTFYGISRNPVFASVFMPHAGEDCCMLGQQFNEIMQRMFKEKGYDILAGDTDSVFPKPLTPKTVAEVEKDLQEIADYINSKVPFPQPTFQIAIEHKIDYIMFVKSEEKTLKKNYAYIWTDTEGLKHVEVMGLPIIKGNATELGPLILEKHIKPRMIMENKGKFEREWMMQIVKDEVAANPKMVAQEYKCQPYESYPSKSRGCIWAQISRIYLGGRGGYIKLIKNRKLGKIGEDDKYCSIEEAEGKLNVQDLDLTKLYNELSPFVKGGLGDRMVQKKSRGLNEFG